MNDDQAERQRYARKPAPARPKGAIVASSGGIAPASGPTPPPLNDFLPPRESPAKFAFHQAVEEPRQQSDIAATVDESGAFHIFSLIVRALKKLDKPTRRRVVALINELELGE